MNPLFVTPDGEFYTGHVLDVLNELPADSVHCVVTSPPYFGHRTYQGDQQRVWRGDPECPHYWQEHGFQRRTSDNKNGTKQETSRGSLGRDIPTLYSTCFMCDAWLGSYGNEPDPYLWADHTIDWLRGIKRVLRPDGVVWLNIGDSFAASGGAHKPEHANPGLSKSSSRDGAVHIVGKAPEGFKPLDLIWSAAILYSMLLDDGWFIRSVVVWNKKNPMPESVSSWRWEQHRIKLKGRDEPTQKSNVQSRQDVGNSWPDNSGGVFLQKAVWVDCPGCKKCLPNSGMILRKGSWRPTESKEWIYLLSKSNDYFCDQEAVREALERPEEFDRKTPARFGGAQKHEGYGTRIASGNEYVNRLPGRNMRDVWEMATHSFKGAHFATFPPELARKCILAGTPEHGVCGDCGKPYARVLTKQVEMNSGSGKSGKQPKGKWQDTQQTMSGDYDIRMGPQLTYQTLGWKRTCKCPGDARVPATVLDPFMGSGTTGIVARQLGRRWIGVDISEEYAKMVRRRMEGQTLSLPLTWKEPETIPMPL